mmetsp:Transcript_39822/g.86157  ORF Transcript_39822/g.86157 Transcript_39822/m.86157 type:complete len:304 (-) Transcript_39822:147-1058(-)
MAHDLQHTRGIARNCIHVAITTNEAILPLVVTLKGWTNGDHLFGLWLNLQNIVSITWKAIDGAIIRHNAATIFVLPIWTPLATFDAFSNGAHGTTVRFNLQDHVSMRRDAIDTAVLSDHASVPFLSTITKLGPDDLNVLQSRVDLQHRFSAVWNTIDAAIIAQQTTVPLASSFEGWRSCCDGADFGPALAAGDFQHRLCIAGNGIDAAIFRAEHPTMPFPISFKDWTHQVHLPCAATDLQDLWAVGRHSIDVIIHHDAAQPLELPKHLRSSQFHLIRAGHNLQHPRGTSWNAIDIAILAQLAA